MKLKDQRASVPGRMTLGLLDGDFKLDANDPI